MGIFDFFKKKHKDTTGRASVSISAVSENDFNTLQFQQEACALALLKIQENGYSKDAAYRELQHIGLNSNQSQRIMDLVHPLLDRRLNENFSGNTGIETALFQTNHYQEDILGKAESWYQQQITNYEFVKFKLLEDGLSIGQADTVVEKLREKVAKMVADFQQDLDSGVIAEIKISPNPDHRKGEVDKEQIDRYIAYGAYQMERGDLENALQLLDKALELDENATLAYANKSSLFARKNDPEKALFFMEKALELEPDNPEFLDARVNFAYDLFAGGKIDESAFITIMGEVLACHPESPNALIYIIQYYLKTNELDRAMEAVRKLFAEYHGEEITIQLMLSIVGRLPEEQALAQFDLIERDASEKAKYQLHYNKGLYLKNRGKFEEAIQLYEDLNKLQPFSWNYYQMAIMRNLQGKTAESLALLRSTFALEPELKEDAQTYPELQNLWSNPEFKALTR